MPLTTAGLTIIAAEIIGGSIPFNAANAYLGVGDSSTAFDPSQTDLQASTNKLRLPMDPSFPASLTNQLTFQATFGPGDANYNWNEWGIFNASTAGTMLARKVETIGSGPKMSGATWTLLVTVTIAG